MNEITKQITGYLEGLALLDSQIGATDWALRDGGHTAAARAAIEERADLCRRRADVRRALGSLEDQRRDLQARADQQADRQLRAEVLGADRAALLADVDREGKAVASARRDLEAAREASETAAAAVAEVDSLAAAARAALERLAAARSAAYLTPSATAAAAERAAVKESEAARDQAERARAALGELQRRADQAGEVVDCAGALLEAAEGRHKRAKLALAAHDVRKVLEAVRGPLVALAALDRQTARDLAAGLLTLDHHGRPERCSWTASI